MGRTKLSASITLAYSEVMTKIVVCLLFSFVSGQRTPSDSCSKTAEPGKKPELLWALIGNFLSVPHST